MEVCLFLLDCICIFLLVLFYLFIHSACVCWMPTLYTVQGTWEKIKIIKLSVFPLELYRSLAEECLFRLLLLKHSINKCSINTFKMMKIVNGNVCFHINIIISVCLSTNHSSLSPEKLTLELAPVLERGPGILPNYSRLFFCSDCQPLWHLFIFEHL